MPEFNRSYLDKVTARLDTSIRKFAEVRNAINKGLVIPDEEDLDIGKGRGLDLAVLFLDICSFSSWPQGRHSDQKEILSIFNIFMAEMMRIAEDHEGEVEKNTGDGLMAYFGGSGSLPATDACNSAVSAAITMLYVGQNFINPALKRDGFREVDFRIGIDYGPVTVAVVGGKRKFKSRVAIGASAIIANRILDECGANQLVVGKMVEDNLPDGRKKHCHLLKSDTGWVQGTEKKPYPYYRYEGRWKTPT